MAGEINVVAPLGSVLASDTTKDDFGRAPLIVGPLGTVTAHVYEHWSVAVTVPMQRIALTMQMGGTFSADLTVPRITVRGYGGANAAVEVPMQTLAAAGTVQRLWRVALEVPLQVVEGAGKTGAGFRAALVVPMQRLSTRMGWKASLTVPLVTGAGQISREGQWSAALSVPLVRGTGTVVVTSRPMNGALVVPLILPGPYSSAALLVPMQQSYGTFVLPSSFEGWALNVRNGGMTRWTNVPFVGFARAGQQTFAVGYDGNLYLLGGDLDNADPVQWSFETGLSDLGSPALKHVPYLYLDGIIDGEIEIALLDDRERVFAYDYDTKNRGAVHQPHRRKLGNGIRTRNLALRVSSTTGAYIELDSLEPEATNTQRSM